MSAAIQPGGTLPGDSFWDRLSTLESRHRELQEKQDRLLRQLDDGQLMLPADELRATWKHYCEVIADLEKAAEKFGDLSLDPG